MTWSFNLNDAPRDGSKVILAHEGKVFASYWCKPKIDPEHWAMLTHKQVPEAWLPWPAYPIAAASQGEAAVPSAERVSPIDIGSAGASTGGGHVTDGENAHLVAAGGFAASLPAACFMFDDCGGGA